MRILEKAVSCKIAATSGTPPLESPLASGGWELHPQTPRVVTPAYWYTFASAFLSLSVFSYFEITKVTNTAFPCPFLAKPHSCLFIYFCPSLCPSWDRSVINKQSYGLDRKGTWKRGKRVNVLLLRPFFISNFVVFVGGGAKIFLPLGAGTIATQLVIFGQIKVNVRQWRQ